VGFDRATRPCAARHRLSNIIHTQNEALRATPRTSLLFSSKIREKSLSGRKICEYVTAYLSSTMQLKVAL
jgi:hypothetical protein